MSGATVQKSKKNIPLVSTEELLGYEKSFWDINFIKYILIPNANINENSKILVAGCGVGAIARLIARILPTVTIEGVELSEGAILAGEAANDHLGISCINFRQGNILELNQIYRDEKFDVVIDDGVLSYLPNKETEISVLNAMKDLLTPGGSIVSFQIDFTSFMYGTDDFEVRDAYYHIQKAIVLGRANHPENSNKRNLMIAPQIPKMMWDIGLRNIKMFPYFPAEDFPPYKAEDVSYVDKRIDYYTLGTKEFNDNYAVLERGGLTKEEIYKYTAVLKEYWKLRKGYHDRQEFPPVQVQNFILSIGFKEL